MTVFKEKNIPIIYPSSDGKPMAENTLQYLWLVKFKEGLEETTQNQNVFVAGDLFWYPVEGDNRTRYAPDVMAVVGRPKGHRSSYMQWREDNIPPQIVIEILSPGNRPKEMKRKLAFYEKYEVEEYIIYNPEKNKLTIFERKGNQLVDLPSNTKKWTSSFLGFRLNLTKDTLEIFHANGQLFKTPLEVSKERNEAIRKAKVAFKKAELAQQQAELAQQQAELAQQETEKERAEKSILAQKLRELGINPDDLLKK